MVIKLSTNYGNTLVRQTPGGRGVWKGARFVINERVANCDAWVVHEGLDRRDSACCPPSRLMLLTGEPPEFKTYPPLWLSDFAGVVTCHRSLAHPRVTLHQTGLPWMVGRGYDELTASDFPEKHSDISVICSNKTLISGHRHRLAFANQLKSIFPMPHFGRGFEPLSDKWDGLAPFRYSLAIENSRHPHYWTEKIADCFLAGTVPVYWGAPNIRDYFPAESMIILESLDATSAAETIRAEATAEAYSRRLPALREAKRLVLDRYNLFEIVYQLARSTPEGDLEPFKHHLRPEPTCRREYRSLQIRNILRRALGVRLP